jgi:drug/metabolite transporter (DMT)-like permease
MRTALGIVLALVSALLLAAASAAEHGAANDVPDERAGGVSMLVDLLRRPLWLVGVTSDVSSFAFQGAALAFGSLLLVQPLLVSSLLFALPLSARIGGRRLGRAEWIWAAVLTAGLIVFVTVGQPSRGIDVAPIHDWVPSAVVLALVVVACLVLASTQKGARRSVPLALITGVTYGITAAMAIGVVHLIGDGLGPLLRSWELWVMLVAALVGWWIQQSAYQAGALTASLPVVMVGEPVVAIALGIGILHERIETGMVGWAAIVVAGLAITVAVVALARSAARYEERAADHPAGAHT